MMLKIISIRPVTPTSLLINFVFSSGMILRCSNKRDYNSEFPMRYVPKKARERGAENGFVAAEDLVKKDMFDCPNSSILGQEYMRDSKANTITNGKMRNEITKIGIPFDDGVIDEDLDHDLPTKLDDTVGDFENMQKREFELNAQQGDSGSIEDAEKIAITLLAARAYTALELKKKLIGRRFTLTTVDAVVSDFITRGLINDVLYAESYSRSRWMSSAWGPRRIKQALYTKGVSASDMEKAVNLIFKDDQCSDEKCSNHGLSKASMDHLYAQASKQWLRGQGVNIETRKARIIRWLQYRGFNWNVISFVLKKLESL